MIDVPLLTDDDNNMLWSERVEIQNDLQKEHKNFTSLLAFMVWLSIFVLYILQFNTQIYITGFKFIIFGLLAFLGVLILIIFCEC
jgi:hypothetical protein